MVAVENQPKYYKKLKKTLTNINSQNGYFCNGYSVVVAKK
jgi:hypothetical protein